LRRRKNKPKEGDVLREEKRKRGREDLHLTSSFRSPEKGRLEVGEADEGARSVFRTPAQPQVLGKGRRFRKPSRNRRMTRRASDIPREGKADRKMVRKRGPTRGAREREREVGVVVWYVNRRTEKRVKER
jgi:hypothetical protein